MTKQNDIDSSLPPVSVIIIVRDMKRTVNGCLKSVFSQSYPRNKYEVIVVDGGSKDGTIEIVRTYPVKCIIETQKGRGRARNRGIAIASGKLIAFIDADCVAYPDWLKKHVDLHSTSSEIYAIGGAILCEANATRMIKLRHYTYFGTMSENACRRFTWDFATCNASFKREIFTKVGLFNEELDIGEDARLLWEANQKGAKTLFDPNPKVLHIHPRIKMEDYLRTKRIDGKAYPLIQIPYRFPVGFVGAVVLFPGMVVLRAIRDIVSLIRYLPSKLTLFPLIPYLIAGSFFWAVGYLESTFVHTK